MRKLTSRITFCQGLLGVLATLAACGDPGGSSSPPPAPPTNSSTVAVTVTSLNIDQARSGTVFVNYPIHAKVGVTSTGSPNTVNISVGLTDPDQTFSCPIGGGNFALKADGSLQTLDIDGLVPPDCLGSKPGLLTNMFVVVDAAGDASASAGVPIGYTMKTLSSATSQACTTTDPNTGAAHTGCVINLNLKPSPGIDVALLAMTPISSVAVLDPAGPPPAPLPGQTVQPRPLISAHGLLTFFGRDVDDPNAAILPGAVGLSAAIIAQPDPNAGGWTAMDINTDAGLASLTTLQPGQQLEFAARILPNAAFRALTSPGNKWAGATNFQARICVTVPFVESGDPSTAGPDGTLNNCQTFPLVLVPGDRTTSLASSLEEKKTYSDSSGSSSSIGVSTSVSSDSIVSLTTASTTNEAKATVLSVLGNFTLFDITGDASVGLSAASGSVDAGISVLGFSVYSYPSSVSASYSVDKSFSKELCATYGYGWSVISVNVKGCFEATVGLAADLTLGSGALTGSVRPYIDTTLTVSVNVSAVSVVASVTVLGVNTNSGDGLTLRFGFSVSGGKVTLSYSDSIKLGLTTLDGSVELKVTIKFAWWKKTYTKTIYSWSGWSKDWYLLSDASSTTLQ